MPLQRVLDYLARVTRVDLSTFSPLYFGQARLGWVNAEWRARLLATEAALFEADGSALHCRAAGGYQAISAELAAAARRWQAAGWLNGWRNENFQACGEDGTPLFELERAAFRPLGLTSRAVHLNGLSRMPDGEVRMWLGRRSPHKAVDPNRMDNMVGGGVAAGETIEMAREREGWEEAGLAADLLRDARLDALLLAERPVARGLHREWLHVFDIWLPPDVIPCNQDGEVAEHCCLPLHEVESLLLAERFMIDAALAAANCLARLGYWGADGARVREACGQVSPGELVY
jgi:8-oxo-dGTP pyrophosphatase MutT (NUDIX family)